MTRVFIDTPCGTVSEHFEFGCVPRMGDVVFLQTEHGEVKLSVKLVEHYPETFHEGTTPVSRVTLQCEVVAR